jgi:CheY-like chemotaxis protein
VIFRVTTLAQFVEMMKEGGGPMVSGVFDLNQRRRGRVLLIDDEAFIVAALRRLLGTEHDITAVMCVADAIVLVENGHRFDVILCDLRMPGMSGIDFYEKLRTLAADMIERIVFCTGATFSADTRQFFERVPNQILEKPFDPVAVRKIVRQFVETNPTDVAV